MAEEDPVEAIEKALGEHADGLQDFERLAAISLNQLQQDYDATIAAGVHQDSEESEEYEEPPQYEVCHSESEEEEWSEMQSAPEEAAASIPASEAPSQDCQLSSDQVKRIKDAMKGLALPPPSWAIGLTDDAFLQFISERIS